MQIKNKTKNKKYFDGSKLKAGIVVARWNSEITDELLVNALKTLKESKLSEKNIKIVRVAGAVEMPFALHQLAKSKKYDFLVAIACIIRGDTPHFDYVCKMAQEGVLKIMIEDNIPVGFGVLTMNNLEQAKVRIHVGGEAAEAALELALLK
ncbi:6,7-dimethyl-8-ribityllumazine synthase [Candidatus Nomurabacteria bacterium RIFCSPLOWO2_01_FULL_42_17]|uniref:6,7-dimethyl-8-ribityllumazine synthase n=1 Tax=Candidatus Nomurabacteria bacterium RIFCSPLOWO2_01_FULL_42_17 TaxID=1801780 RepID=A0A1F6XLS0_9BACT|nr:MAG: 6,7-dimethyl-8-ribityllumazine synthase [Candidatus Nomurabacteria bacterium RIFCSPLOWO2_01_FULL_42_17]